MNFENLKEVLFSIIDEKDPYRAPKQLHLENWCKAFIVLLSRNDMKCLSFLLEVLSDEECWERTDTIHCINLNRRIVVER